MKLNNETEKQRREEASIGAADIARCRAWVASWDFVVKYLDGDTVKRIQAKAVRGLWGADGK